MQRRAQLLEFAARKEPAADAPAEAGAPPPAPARQTAGELLRLTRERYRQDLETVAEELRIRLVYLRAIEEGRYDALPGTTYAIGFVRSYADYLGLDSREIVRRFREELAQTGGEPELVFPEARPERRVPLGAVLLLLLGLGGAAYGGWYYWTERQPAEITVIPQVPERLKALVEEPPPAAETPAAASSPAPAPSLPGPHLPGAAPTGTAPTPSPPAPAESAPPALDGAPAGAVADAAATAGAETELAAASAFPIPPLKPSAGASDAAAGLDPAAAGPVAPAPEGAPAVAPEEAAAPPPAPAAPALSAPAAIAAVPADPTTAAANPPQVFGATNAGSRVLLYARMESWIQVTDADNVPLWTRVLRAGDSYLLPDQPGLTLSTGNAGGLDIFVDGQKIPPLGPIGVERRGVALDPDLLRSGAAVQ